MVKIVAAEIPIKDMRLYIQKIELRIFKKYFMVKNCFNNMI